VELHRPCVFSCESYKGGGATRNIPIAGILCWKGGEGLRQSFSDSVYRGLRLGPTGPRLQSIARLIPCDEVLTTDRQPAVLAPAPEITTLTSPMKTALSSPPPPSHGLHRFHLRSASAASQRRDCGSPEDLKAQPEKAPPLSPTRLFSPRKPPLLCRIRLAIVAETGT